MIDTKVVRESVVIDTKIQSQDSKILNRTIEKDCTNGNARAMFLEKIKKLEKLADGMNMKLKIELISKKKACNIEEGIEIIY